MRALPAQLRPVRLLWAAAVLVPRVAAQVSPLAVPAGRGRLIDRCRRRRAAVIREQNPQTDRGCGHGGNADSDPEHRLLAGGAQHG